MNNNFNIDKNAMSKLNSMLQNGDISKLMENVPPELMEQISNLSNPNGQKSSPNNFNKFNNVSNNDGYNFNNSRKAKCP